MTWQTIILGAGAAGMMCAAHSGPQTLLLDHAKAPGEKIRISGGGRCNFTNLYAGPENFLSQNPHFCKSALSRYSQWDFIELVQKHRIAYHEKTLGQLFCDHSAKDIIQMLLAEMHDAGAELWLNTSIDSVRKTESGFEVKVSRDGKAQTLSCQNLVLATGGKSIPKMGATGLAYDIATQFDLSIIPTHAGLVPFTFPEGRFKPLAGLAHAIRATTDDVSFDEALLFTHRGLSGPAMLQISNYWQESQPIRLNLFPDVPLLETLKARRKTDGRKQIGTVLAQLMPARLAEFLLDGLDVKGNLADQSDAALQSLCEALLSWQVTPSGTEGYRTAEVTLGGIDTDALSSKTMEAKTVSGLYAIGEAVDVTGWLGGYNFQWAWSSGHAAGTAIRAKR
ncbi:NAD(P)/FAD-dependent oxidoreductase [Cognatishimia maritima]|uniref:Flavoprotein, HI0933 family n=1 Tax=Cognatishimia maritima TaxID=870908 RepID=A0A1M5VGK1_9RHOB|nr:NAD(P)/FAD-dependent oxidoreductase [Cognatishimia maritima]SHH74305.1 hypothetical protein SAMN04488044_3159 [Cognatishimia maritima]